MKIAIEGCAHGELEKIYETIAVIEEANDIKVDLLICCGDFQSSRNETDLMCMAVPQKYRSICTFYKYYSGEKTAPVLTIFIGGNHEASNYLQELPYGGWVAPNIYYLGYAGVINVAGIRIAGLSGIYKSGDYLRGHHEKPPYDEYTRRSVYHVRNLEVFRLKQISNKIDIFLSHDWPGDVYEYGNVKQLLKQKPHFREDVEKKELGSKACQELLHHLKPKYWFSAHLHCKFAALVKHEDDTATKFLALDKCLPKRKFLQVVEVKSDEDSKVEIAYDLEWLAVLYATNHLLWVKPTHTYMPGPGTKERCNFTPTDEEMRLVSKRFNNDLVVPKNFTRTAPAYDPSSPAKGKLKAARASLNPQNALFCKKLAVDDPLSLVIKLKGHTLTESADTSSSFTSEDLNTTTSSFIDDTLDADELNSPQNSPFKRRLNLSLPDPKSKSTPSDEAKEEEELVEHSFAESCDASSIGSGDEPSLELGGNESGAGNASFNESRVGNASFNVSRVGNAPFNESRVGNASFNVSRDGNASFNESRAGNASFNESRAGNASFNESRAGNASFNVSRVGNASFNESGVEPLGVDAESVVVPSEVDEVSFSETGVEDASSSGPRTDPEGVGDESSSGSGVEPEGVGVPAIVSAVESIGVGDASLIAAGVESMGVDGASSVEAEVVAVESGVEALGVDEVVEESKLPTPPKKLRRRNIEMYRSDDTKD